MKFQKKQFKKANICALFTTSEPTAAKPKSFERPHTPQATMFGKNRKNGTAKQIARNINDEINLGLEAYRNGFCK